MRLDQVRRILVLNRNHIGDCLLTTPMLRALKRRFPRAHLAVSVPSSNKDLLITNPHVDEIVVRPRTSSWGAKLRFALEMRDAQYDLIISLQEKSLFYGWATLFAGLSDRKLVTVGLDDRRTRRFYRHVSPIRPNQHEVYKYLDLAYLLGCPQDRNPVLELEPTTTARKRVDKLLLESGLAPESRFVAINPGGTKPEKWWPVERFAAVADRLQEELGLPAVILGGAVDLPRATEIAAQMRTRPLVVAGRTTLADTAAMMERCALLVTGDTGPMHMAVALAVPVVVLFGPTSPVKFGPFSRHGVVLKHEEPCMRCRHSCLHTITVEETLDAALHLCHTSGAPRPARRAPLPEISSTPWPPKPARAASGPEDGRMRIALVNSIRFFGGGEHRTMRAARDFAARGHEVTVIGLAGSELEARCREQGTAFFPVTLGHYLAPKSAEALRRALQKLRADVAVCYDERSARVAALAGARIPLVYYVGLQGSLKDKLFNRMFVGPRFARFIPNAEATREELLAFGWLPEQRLQVIHDGVDPSPIDAADPAGAREELGARPGQVVAITVARLVPEKGHAFLLQALSGLPEELDYKLWIAGVGPELEALVEERDRLGLSGKVDFLGFRTDVPRLLRAADLMVHPSRREGAPNSVREAMAAGLPVIAVAASGTPEVVAHGETGLLSEVGDLEALKRHLQRLLADEQERRRLGEAGRRRALTEFSEDHCAERWLAMLRQCIQEHAGLPVRGSVNEPGL
ncbi:MAG: glycosyltransferase [Armatimonadota bacterium]